MLFAKKLVQQTNAPEEEYRSAVSRAYYSLYHETLHHLVQKYSFDLINSIEKAKRRQLTQHEKTRLDTLTPPF